jgi:hypothetical protein
MYLYPRNQQLAFKTTAMKFIGVDPSSLVLYLEFESLVL